LLSLVLLLLLLLALVLLLLILVLLLFIFLLLLLFRLSLLLLFRGLWLLLCVRGSKGSEKKEQNSGADKCNWFHECCLQYGDLLRPSLVTSGAVIVSGGCLR
jgi:fatty acid desaturase